jgi:hypothetical protein
MSKLSQKNMIQVEFSDDTGEVLITTLVPIVPQVGQGISLPGDQTTYEVTDVTYQVGGQFKVKAQVEPRDEEHGYLPEVVEASEGVADEDRHRPWMVTTIAIIIIWLNLMILVAAKSCSDPTPAVVIPDASPTVTATASASAPVPSK